MILSEMCTGWITLLWILPNSLQCTLLAPLSGL